MVSSLMGPLVSVSWLAANLAQPNLVILDASLRKDSAGEVQIAGTRIFDIDRQVCDKTSSLPHMLPLPEQFAQEARAVGVNQDSLIVIYDRAGIYSSPRARWMFQAMGHKNVAVLDGGLPAWVKAGLPVKARSARPVVAGNFDACACGSMVSNATQVRHALNQPNYAVLDARSAARFRGHEAEPREGLRLGHMPNAINLPFTSVLQNGHMRPSSELSAIFTPLAGRKMIFSCGSGVTACIIAFAAELSGIEDISVYDGSWSEWGLPSDLPVVTEPEL